MRLAVFGATGSLGKEIALQAVASGHTITVLVRDASRLDKRLSTNAGAVTVIEGDALEESDISKALVDAEAVLFALGMSSSSPPNLCSRATALILGQIGTERKFIWCGGGSTQVDGDPATLGK